MINPSYSSLIEVLNKDAEVDQKITSRYSIVIAAAKRARQIVGGAAYDDMGLNTDKAVSIAINEIFQGHVRIVPKAGAEAWEHEHIVQNLPTLIDDSFVMAEGADDLETAEFEDIAEDAEGEWDEDDILEEDDEEDDDE
ncbi:MAG: DNA-directed RNA polymerase subunit omega [Clostridiales bacterium]|jgi:DNA-directed RNA polymerase subunit omega|nr:DNA-directed RNA polymerase subunit omega [Clostridiales bacterium]